MKRRSWKANDEKGMTPYKLEAILRHYDELYEMYLREGMEEFSLDDGTTVNIHDLLQGIDELPKRQRTALLLTCIGNLKEVEAAPGSLHIPEAIGGITITYNLPEFQEKGLKLTSKNKVIPCS